MEQRLPDGMAPDPWLAALGSIPLSYQPGERFHYSHSTDVLGFLVARIAGMPFRDFLRKRIFEPLQMHDTDFWTPADKRDRAAVVYRPDAKSGQLQPVPFREHTAPPVFCSGGGGLVSTADDYLHFARLLLNGGRLDGVQLLQRDTLASMTRNRLTDAQRQIPFMGIPFWAGQGIRARRVGDHRSRQTGVDGTRLEGRVRLAGRIRHLVAGRSRERHGPDLSDPELATARTGDGVATATGQRLGSQMALPHFQRLVHDAIRN
jgi:CubicO group peptidase (beta-lactamase class C family)